MVHGATLIVHRAVPVEHLPTGVRYGHSSLYHTTAGSVVHSAKVMVHRVNITMVPGSNIMVHRAQSTAGSMVHQAKRIVHRSRPTTTSPLSIKSNLLSLPHPLGILIKSPISIVTLLLNRTTKLQQLIRHILARSLKHIN